MLSVVANVSATRMLLHHGHVDEGWVSRLAAGKTVVVGALAYHCLSGRDLPPAIVLARPGLTERSDWPIAAQVDVDPALFFAASILEGDSDLLVVGGERTLLAALPHASVAYVELTFGTLPGLGRRFVNEDGWGPWEIEDCRRFDAGSKTMGFRYELHRKV